MKNIIVQTDNHITTILINRPHVKNAVDGATAQELADAFRAFDADDDAHVAVFGGTNGVFCAGADLKTVSGQGVPHRMEREGDAPMGPSRMLLSKPVIAAVAGYAVAGGLELACWCDMRVVEESAIMGVFCRRWGVPLMDGGTIRLPRIIGMGRAMDLILTGRPVNAQEALMMGLANRVVSDGTAIIEAQRLAQSLLKFPQTCMRNDRMSAYMQWDMSLEEALKQEFDYAMEVIATNETVIGAKRFASGKGRHGNFEDI